MALAKCFDRVRSGEVDRGEGAGACTEVLLDSICGRFEGRRFGAAVALEAGLEPFLETGFTVLPFKRIDLPCTGA